jgi:hypothetical protein
MFYLIEVMDSTTMSKSMPTAPSAPVLEEQQLLGQHMPPPPPSYDQAMRHGGFVLPPSQAAMAPNPQPNCK